MTKPAPAPAKAPYVMPKPRIGDTVLWHDDLESENPPMPAWVTRVSEDCLDLSILEHGVPKPLLKDGVRHINDPDKAKIKRLEAGCWDFIESQSGPPSAAKLSAAENRIAILENQVTELKLRLDELTTKK